MRQLRPPESCPALAGPTWSRLCMLGLGLVLAACQSAAPLRPPPVLPLPEAYRQLLPAAPAMPSDAATELPAGLSAWSALGSRELERLLDRALAYNPDLRIGTLQLAQARYRVDQTQASWFPTVTAPLKSAIQAPGGVVGSVPAAGTSGATQRSYQGSVMGTWRPDIWGELGALQESAELQVARAVYARHDSQRMILANVANAYISYLAMNDAIALANDNLALARELQSVLERRVQAQDATLNELEQQRAAVFVQQAAIPALQQQREELRTTLAQWLGTVPQTLDLSDAGLSALALPETLPGLPSALLLRRPDIRMMEARLQAAQADVEVARARLLPPVDLSAQAGSSALALSQLLQPQSLFWNAIASLAVTVFDGGRRQADKALAQAQQEEMLETYAKTVYQAVREVELALSSVREVQARLEAQQGATRAALSMYKTASDAYALGAVDLFAVLDARRNYQRNVDDTLRVRSERLRAQVSLTQALGLGVPETLPDLPSATVLPGPVVHCTGELPRKQQCLATAVKASQIVLGGQGLLPVAQGWQVSLPGLYHRDAVLPLERDLSARFGLGESGSFLVAQPRGQADERRHAGEAWFSVHVAGFGNQAAADRFCASLRQMQQACELRSDSALLTDALSKPSHNGS